MSMLEIQILEIGDFKDVAVIEMLVKVGDTVKAEQSLFTVKSERSRRPPLAPSRRWRSSAQRAPRPCICLDRIVDSTGALALKSVSKRMLLLGGGFIGLEMGTVYSTLGARLDLVEMMDGGKQGADHDLVKVWQKMNALRFDNIMVNTKTAGAEATPEGIKVGFEPAKDGVTVPEPQVCDLGLQAVGLHAQW